MTQVFLKTKTVPVDELSVTITQLSGLERLDFMEFCSNIPEPDRPFKPSSDASEVEQDKYLAELNKYTQKWFRINFLVQARLVAYGYRDGVDDIEERHKQIMSMMTPQQVETLHYEIASFSGLPVPEQEEAVPSDGSDSTTTTETTTTEETTTQEPTDPKV
ncbi:MULTISPECIES: phage minor tail protein G [Vibrio]|uniref:phage minor tail protein G n=1 Tax=Vibrio TaxID=662 RepID=UPI001869F766|nr:MULTISPECIES: phage minor tail protein G [Vibrio]MBE4320415.1 hypothetical protein [Vibrio parahaemolyticus]MBE4337932.1 hypothetical protein [Vibrio parahaemolyticus]MBT0115792.1 hypothetical protein [Vibrio alginolyticus]MCS0334444.1 hypothetical protein [Vibrio diabolicus]MDW2069602.1 phage minor tail protein G [Vibrio sp. 2096]